jgi:glucosamine 6-phosphate synthetase-like amidotransferase/phosphosugar isomerase protein
MTDSELIAFFIEEKMNEGQSLGQAIKNVCETKLYGTWRLAILGE